MVLDGRRLKVARDLLEDEGGVAAADRDRDQRGDGGVMARRGRRPAPKLLPAASKSSACRSAA